ncbi:protein of unknown function [Azospirillum baldaniorum]|uniref:Uncharacterized protein n=1 Tax=Azospirillum baldaniorum TaxID=1064539 RepID=A0A9P1JQ39_9PROT|nr:protein of unknown function [Azospirillum baldaniorum]
MLFINICHPYAYPFWHLRNT